MGFLKRIFRRKSSKKDGLVSANGSSDSNISTIPNRKLSRKERKALKKSMKSGSFLGGATAQNQNKSQIQKHKEQMNAMASGSGSGTDSYSPPQDRPQKQYPQENSQQQRPLHSPPTYNHYDVNLDPMCLSFPSDSSPSHGPTGSPTGSEEMVRKPAFHQHHIHGSFSTGSDNRSATSSQGRSPNSHSNDGDERRLEKNEDSGYNSRYYSSSGRRSNNEKRSPNTRHDDDEDEMHDVGMVQFDGENAFNNNQNKDRSNMISNFVGDEQNTTNSPTQLSMRRSPQYSDRKSPLSTNNNNLQYEQVQQLEQFNNQKLDRPYHGMYNGNNHNSSNNKTLQLKRLPDGQLVRSGFNEIMSPASASSEFDLSTDGEDNEYNHMRRTANSNMKPMLSPQSESESSKDDYDQRIVANRSRHYFSDSDHDTLNSPNGGGSIDVKASLSRDSLTSPNDRDNDEDASSRKGSVNHKPNGNKSIFSFDNEFEEALVKSKRKGSLRGSDRPPSPTAFQKINKATKRGVDDEKSQLTEDKSFDSAMSPRTLAIRAAQKMRAQGYSEYDLDMRKRNNNDNILPPRSSRSKGSDLSAEGGKIIREKTESDGVIENFADFETFGNNEFHRTAKSVADPTSPVSELLSQARTRRKNRKGASKSVNSEPALNAFAIRQQLNLPSQQTNSEAKKKLEHRRQEKERFLQLLQEGKSGVDEDSDREKEKNESWLFDEVKGALGPRAVAADLESLGERSNRSKASIGNKSHRSQKSYRSNKSYRSQKSSTSHRRPKRSDESVGSRHSRSSRYSIKSTKSHLSQMSQESRSVANDLIRLEMQLAMIGSSLKKGENEVKKQLELDAQRRGLKDGISVGESSIGMKSYSSRKSRRNVTIPKRTKTVVKAPPGKLGIILANRTDSKGTVVSGVRTTSVLADRISPGDRIIAIDGEDVSRMTVPEITAIMARKSDYERLLTVLKSPQR